MRGAQGQPLREPPYRPRLRRHGKRRRREAASAQIPEPIPARRAEPGDVSAGRTDAEQERVPPLVEARVLDVDRQDVVLHLTQAGGVEKLGEVAPARAGKPRFVLDVGIEFARRAPEQTERPLATGVIPDARGDDPVGPGDPAHLAKSLDRIGHEMHDQLCQRRVEGLILERKLLGGAEARMYRGVADANRVDETFGGVDRPDVVGPRPRDQLADQRSRATTNIEDPAAGRDAGELDDLGASGTE